MQNTKNALNPNTATNINSIGTHWQRKKEQRPTEIIQAARKLFVKQGFSATKVAEIAKAAGVQSGTLYVYFKNKEALFKAVIENSITPLINFANEIIDHYEGSPQELITLLVNQWWEKLNDEQCQGITKLLTSESQNFPELTDYYMKACIEPAKTMIYRILEYALRKEQIQLLNMESTARIIFMLLHELIIYSHSFRKFEAQQISDKALINTTADFIIRSVLIPQEKITE